MEMTKWFDTNYHYIVPEFSENQKFTLASTKVVDEFQEALAMGIRTKPVLLGPCTFLKLGKVHGKQFDRSRSLPGLIDVYVEVLRLLASAGAVDLVGASAEGGGEGDRRQPGGQVLLLAQDTVAVQHLGHQPGDFPEAEACARECLALPIFPELESWMLNAVSKRVLEFYAR